MLQSEIQYCITQMSSYVRTTDYIFSQCFHLIIPENLKVVQPLLQVSSGFFLPKGKQVWVWLVYTDWALQGKVCPLGNTSVWSSLYSWFCSCLSLSFFLFAACLCACLQCLDTIHHLIQLDPALVWREVACAEYTNCFLVVRDKLLASPFKLHFRVWLPYSAKQCQWCQISGSKVKIKC